MSYTTSLRCAFSPLLRPRIRQVLPTAAQRRYLNLQEYQSKALLEDHGLTIQPFVVAGSSSEAKQQLETFHAPEYVVKAQILAGGRGRGTFSNGLKGGVRLTEDPKEAISLVDQMVGQRLVTKQTPADGVLVNKVMICYSLAIARETYLAILLDREAASPVIVASPAGGVDIEEVAEKTPELIFKEHVDINSGLTEDQALRLASQLQFEGPAKTKAADQIGKLYEMFLKLDATQIEINPFGETDKRDVVCFDAKLNFDDSAAFRQKSVFDLDDQSEMDPAECAAQNHNLNYVGLDGDIACLVNGAGLAMATMDIIQLHGGSPANFLDVGGGVQSNQVVEAFRIVSSHSGVKAILVNVFGGIVDCQTIANGLIDAMKKITLAVPLVVRLEGTNAKPALELLNQSGMDFILASDLDEAAKKAVASIR